MKAFFLSVIVSVVTFLSPVARAELVIEITQGIDNPTVIAISPFAWDGPGVAPEDVAFVIQNDLYRSGQFAPWHEKICWVRPLEMRTYFFAIGGW